jgi:quercetin dioxygenase-like cupin family protein
MKSQRTFILVVATIMTAAALQPARTNAQGPRAATNLHRAHLVQAVVDGGHKASQEAGATPVMSKLLPDFPGKEVVMLTVTYPPGHAGPVHRHNADAFIYVLEGSVEMAVNGGEPVTLGPGQTFYEGPNDIHTIGRNASKTRPAKLLVFMIKDKDAPISVPVK